MFGEFVVDRGAVSITQRKRGRIRGKALPQQLNEPEPVFDGELQNLDYVGVTHAR